MPITIDGTGTITGATTLASTVASPTFTTPALGIPASGTLTNCTGLPVAGGGTGLTALAPAFSVTNSTNQSFSASAFTRVTLDTEIFDTNSAFASSKFTPQVAGYYQFNGSIRFAAASMSAIIVLFYKNGAAVGYGTALFITGADNSITVSEIIECNGSTDFIELYGYLSGSTPNFNYANSSANCRMSGALIRAA